MLFVRWTARDSETCLQPATPALDAIGVRRAASRATL
jgi:hypothetical protein